MDRNSLKKMGAVGSAVIVVLAFLSVPVLYVIAEAPVWLVASTFLVLLVIAAVTAYHTVERLKEIEGGLEDDIDDYREHPRQELRDHRSREGEHGTVEERGSRHRAGAEVPGRR